VCGFAYLTYPFWLQPFTGKGFSVGKGVTYTLPTLPTFTNLIFNIILCKRY
jgi:hypothetical protein